MRKIRILTGLLLILLTVQVFGQKPDYVLFEQGIKFYRQKNYSAAKASFLKITSEFPNSKVITASLLMLMRSQYQLAEYQTAEATGNFLIKKYENSSYKDDAYFWLGCTKLQMKNNQGAVLYWLLAFKYADDDRLKEDVSDYLRRAMFNLLSEKELDKLATRLDDPDLKVIATVSYARILITQRQPQKANRILKDIVRRYPNNRYSQWAEKIMNDVPLQRSGFPKILVTIPQTGAYGAAGQNFMTGFKYALQTSHQVNNAADYFNFIDDSSRVVHTILQTEKALEEYKSWGLLGGLTNETAAALSVLARYNKLPVISPTANQNIIHQITSEYYQINPDPFTKGKQLANFAKQHLNHKTVALIAPLDDYGKEFISGFKSVWVDTDSVTVLAEQYFEPGTESFLNQLKSIRKRALQTFFFDSIKLEKPELTDEELLSMYNLWLDEKMKQLEENFGRKVDTTTIPVENIDLFVSAIRSNQIEAFARQYAFFNFKAQLLGNEGWYDEEVVQKVKNYLNGLILVSPIYINQEDNSYRNFRNQFRMTMQTTPDKMHVLGYNVAKWLLEVLAISDTKDDFERNLINYYNFTGIGQQIRFDENSKINQSLNVLQFKFGRFFKIQ